MHNMHGENLLVNKEEFEARPIALYAYHLRYDLISSRVLTNSLSLGWRK
jgi:hypothetical protein